jgi:hypothetical protein
LIPVEVRDGWTGITSVIPGGTIYRFAVVVDCKKCIPERIASPIKADPRLLDVCRQMFGIPFYEVGGLH